MALNNSSYKGTLAWGYGTSVEGLATSQEAAQAGGLDWGVTKAPLVAVVPKSDGTFENQIVNGKFHVRRDDNDKIIGIVGKNFRPVPNLEAMGLMDALAQEAGAIFKSVGSIGDGERVWMMAQLPNSLRIKGSEDIIDKYLLLSNAHNGSKSLVMGFTPFRRMGASVMNIAVGRLNDKLSIRHTAKFDEHVKEARRVLKLQEAYFEHLGIMFDGLADVPVDNKKFNEVLDAVMPLPTEGRTEKAEGARERLESLWAAENKVNPFANTAWSLFSAFSNYGDHEKSFKSRKDDDGSKDQLRFLSIMEGSAQALKNDALSAILDLK
jgi:phage/plasmid-like protein (TIGR03299 family)